MTQWRDPEPSVFLHRACACAYKCGDCAEADDHPYAVCKGLPMPPREPLVTVVMVPRDAVPS